MSNPTICFIGAGNMARSLIGGLIANGHSADNIIASDINQAQLDRLGHDFAIRTETNNNTAVASADIVILAVKPQVLRGVCNGIAGLSGQPLFISIAAGIRETDINRWLGGGHAIVRCMPNTPALVGLGASALYANDSVSPGQREQAINILQSVGIAVWVEQEAKLDTVTALSGSGPAYFFLFIEELQKAAVKLGLDKDTAGRLARQTALGAANMAMEGDVITLRQQVTSKGGTTERAIQHFQDHGLGALVSDAVDAAARRSRELADELAKDTDN